MYVRTRFPSTDMSDKLVDGAALSSFSVFVTWFVVRPCFAERGMLNIYCFSQFAQNTHLMYTICQETDKKPYI